MITVKDNNIAVFHSKSSTSKHTENTNGTSLANKFFRSSYFFFYYCSWNLISRNTTSVKDMQSYVEVSLMAKEKPLSL